MSARRVRPIPASTIHLWIFLAVLFAIVTAKNVVMGEWGEAVDGIAFTIVSCLVVTRSRDINALIGGRS